MRIKVRRIIGMPLIFILMFTSCLYSYPRQVEAKESSIYQGERFEVKFYLDSVYDDGYNARIELTNTSSQTIEDWVLVFSFGENISSAWNGTLSKLEDGTYQIQNAGWNQDIKAGETITFGFSGSCTQTPNSPIDYELIGAQCTADPKEYDITCDIVEQWSSGYIVKVNITNLTAFTMKDWMLEFSSQNGLESMWGASISNNSDSTYQVRNNNNNQNISAYNTVSFNYMVTSSKYVEPCNFKLFYQSLDSTLVESLAPTTSSVAEEPIKSIEPTVTEESPTANPTESILPTDSEVPVTSETPITSEIPIESEDPEEEIDMTDTDGDGLIDVLEELIGTDPLLTDTDGDLLSDYEEIYLVGTDPLLIESDGNGVMDANDDFDLDGLANKDELILGTSPMVMDSDYDGLNDGDEVNQYRTDPLNEDTDGDTITDGNEILLGLNPLLPDSDGDGIADNEEKIEQTFRAAIEDEEKPEVTKVEVAFAGTGNIKDTTEIESVYGEDLYSSDLVGLVGTPIEIETESEFDSATITFSYDESKLGEVEEENLAIMWYDKENHDYVQMDSEVDKEKNTVSCDTTHFSTYMLYDIQQWLACWKESITYRYKDYHDLAVVCENSYDMWDYDNGVGTLARAVAYNIEKGDHLCEIEYGTGACVEFDFGQEENFNYTTVNEDWDDAILYPASYNGATNVGYGYNTSKGIKLALEELEGLGSDNPKDILLFCSGTKMDDVSDVVEQAKENNVSITTVNLIDGAYSSVLKEMAEETGGTYIDISGYDLYSNEDLTEIAYLGWDAFDFLLARVDARTIDSDKDGIADIYEEEGVRASNGQIVYCEPDMVDSDGDGLTDSEELEISTEEDSGVVAYLCSNPLLSDSDQDDLYDYEDPRPLSSINNGKALKMVSSVLTNVQKWLVTLGYLDMGDNPYGVNYGALTRTAVNVYQLNHAFRLKTYMDVNTYATIANEYYYKTGQGESAYRNECGTKTTKKYYSSIRIVEPTLTKYYKNIGVKVVKATNSTIKSSSASNIEIYLYDYSNVVMKMLENNEQECKTMKTYTTIKKWNAFSKRVTNDGPWDIKRKEQWRVQMRTVEWCSTKFPFIVDNDIVNPEILGNITYGYWGTCAGISIAELIAGGNYASIAANKTLDSGEDTVAVVKGVKLYNDGHS